MKKAVLILILLLNITCVYAKGREGFIKDTHAYVNDVETKKLTDNNYRTIETIPANQSIILKSNIVFKNVYIIYSLNTEKGTLKYNNSERKLGENLFLHELVELDSSTNEISITYQDEAQIKEIFVFGEVLPDWVEKWAPSLNEADLLLFSTHSDDDQIFFAGLIPHTLNANKSVQVVYLTKHLNHPHRFDEALSGLWTVGIKNYPIFGPVPDAYSKSLDKALENLKKVDLTLDDVIHFEVDMIRKFKPKVVVSHDEEGEYGHGQHRLITYALESSVRYLDDANYKSVYRPYLPYKIYLHLYKENPIIMDYDIPLEKYEGKTAFQVSMEGLAKHESQLNLIWGKWLKYKSTNEIRQYNPKYLGLYFSSVGYENKDNDMFYNIPTNPLGDYSPSLIPKTTTKHKNKEVYNVDKLFIYTALGIIFLLVVIDLYIIIAKKK